MEPVASSFAIITFGAQITKQLYELRGLYKEFLAAPGDIDNILTDCERYARVLEELELQWRAIQGLIPGNLVFDECNATGKAALDKLDAIARNLKAKTSKSRVKGSIRTILLQDEISKQKDQIRTAKEDIA